jgi:hypothetical protein
MRRYARTPARTQECSRAAAARLAACEVTGVTHPACDTQIRAVLRSRGLEFCDDEASDAGASLATEHARATADALRHEQLVAAGVAASSTDAPEQAVGE